MFKRFEGTLALVVPPEGRVFLCELMEGLNYPSEVLDGPLIVRGKPKGNSHFLDVGGWFEVLYGL